MSSVPRDFTKLVMILALLCGKLFQAPVDGFWHLVKEIHFLLQSDPHLRALVSFSNLYIWFIVSCAFVLGNVSASICSLLSFLLTLLSFHFCISCLLLISCFQSLHLLLLQFYMLYATIVFLFCFSFSLGCCLKNPFPRFFLYACIPSVPFIHLKISCIIYYHLSLLPFMSLSLSLLFISGMPVNLLEKCNS